MQYPYVGSDLDGTIVRNEDFQILDETIADILNYQKVSGGNFFIVTGRMYEAMKLYIHQLQVKLPVISCNGAVITDPVSKQVIYENNLAKPVCLKIIKFAQANQLDLMIYTAKTIAALTTSERGQVFKKHYGHLPPEFAPNLQEFENYDLMYAQVETNILNPVKFLFSFPKAGMEAEKQKTLTLLDELQLNHPTTYINDRFLVDAMNKSTTKASGVAQWAKYMKVNVKDIHVIGDNNNDHEMVQQSNYGIAVENGVASLKEHADIVIEHIDENGVGKYLQNLIEKVA
ncbi:HAD family hydrolase [Spiroplasma clarkii]|uniref:HAD family hydrolase n=1 Tax=Spiroplasma clarkii TaxID=2139 RepID=A0A1Y0L0B6_9MOLU|nr:HAD family hydrolase [Spiroplasma clarkii]ARU91464.1 HAD family hydrolase [Spiroplasma clarkii]ATX70886.1 HAD family hydrolase [Spiroplasma clarkii]